MVLFNISYYSNIKVDVFSKTCSVVWNSGHYVHVNFISSMQAVIIAKCLWRLTLSTHTVYMYIYTFSAIYGVADRYS